jgi:hypothetical protein
VSSGLSVGPFAARGDAMRCDTRPAGRGSQRTGVIDTKAGRAPGGSGSIKYEPRENQARGGPALPVSVGSNRWQQSPGKGQGPPRDVDLKVRVLVDARDNRGERTGRDPRGSRAAARTFSPGPNDAPGRADGRTRAVSAVLGPLRALSLWRVFRNIATPKPGAPGSSTAGRESREGARAISVRGPGKGSGRATSPGLGAPTGGDGGGRPPRALTLSAPRAAGLMPSTIQQLSPCPIRNSGTTYFLRKAGLSGPT